MEALGSPSLFPSSSLPRDQAGHILKPCLLSYPIPQGHFHTELMFLLLQIHSCTIYLKLPKVLHFCFYLVTLLFCPKRTCQGVIATKAILFPHNSFFFVQLYSLFQSIPAYPKLSSTSHAVPTSTHPRGRHMDMFLGSGHLLKLFYMPPGYNLEPVRSYLKDRKQKLSITNMLLCFH